MAADDTPTLDHGIPSPETYLPGTPVWFWWVLGVGVFVLLVLLLWAVKLLRPTLPPPAPAPRDLYTPAMATLAGLEEECSRELVSVIAARASLVVRTYLADTRSEPALYETAEEFEARQTKLPASANAFLNDLNEVKYAKSSIDEERARELLEQSRECLKKLHAFAPKDPPPLALATIDQNHPWRDRAVALFPLGLAAFLTSFLYQLYDGRDTGAEIEMTLFGWLALSVGGVALLFHLIFRRQP